MNKLFGTDGIRGIANTELTPELAMAIGRAGAIVAGGEDKPARVVVGRDTRLSGEMLESALIAGVMSTGAEVLRLSIIPTPAVAYLTRQFGADAGMVVSASHNPVNDNGIKLFNRSGFKFSPTEEESVEKLVVKGSYGGEQPIGAGIGRATDIGAEGRRRYTDHVVGSLPVSLTGVRVVLDCCYGAAFSLASEIFRQAGADVVEINCQPRGDRINVDCGSTNPLRVRDEVVSREGHIGFAFDGDADRVMAVDEDGLVLDGDYMLAIVADYLKTTGSLSGGSLVTTVMANSGFDIAMKANNISVIKTDVGDRYVLQAMLEHELNLGGEQSGHMIFLDQNTTGDGIVTALTLSSVMAKTGRQLKDLKTIMNKLPQVLLNVRVADKSRLTSAAGIWSEVEKQEHALGGHGRILVRSSGTEPLVRVMVEAETEDTAANMANTLAGLVERELGG